MFVNRRQISYAMIFLEILALCLCSLPLGIADIVIGAKFMNDNCHIHNLQLYLIILGCVCIINFNVFITQHKNDDGSKNFSMKYIYIFNAIEIGVNIWGMILVWDSRMCDCSSTLFNYAYYRTIIIMFIITGLFAYRVMTVLFVVLGSCCCEEWINNCLNYDSATSEINITEKKIPPGNESTIKIVENGPQIGMKDNVDKFLNTVNVGKIDLIDM